MAPSSVHLPNGQHLTVAPVFGGLSFIATDQVTQRGAASSFPPGWTVILNEEEALDGVAATETSTAASDHDQAYASRKHTVHRYKKPTLQNDHMYISAISNPNSADFKPPTSPTRQVAMMLWATLWWYFHQPEPEPRVTTKASSQTAEAGRPKAEWKININKEGIFRAKNVLPKLERMGLLTTEDSSVAGSSLERLDTGWNNMFVSRRAFWQIDARIFLFTLSPTINSPVPGSTPFTSRPGSPVRGGTSSPGGDQGDRGAATPVSFGPFQSSSHLPTYYPPHPSQYTFTNNIRHPIRPKPFRQGETFYCRFVPSVHQYLSFRVASLSPQGVPTQGPWSAGQPSPAFPGMGTPRHSIADAFLPTTGNLDLQGETDVAILHRWMNNQRVSHFWGEEGPQSHQERFLQNALSSKHSFPVIGCWNGKPFGYFEIYWAKEDVLGGYLGRDVDNWDRGLHCLVGEEEFRGAHRVHVWLSALVHYCWLADLRTNQVLLEPRVDNEK